MSAGQSKREIMRTGYEPWDRLLGGIEAGLVVVRGSRPATLRFVCMVAARFASLHAGSKILIVGFGPIAAEPGVARVLLEQAQAPDGSAHLFTGKEDDLDAMVHEIAQLKPSIVLVDAAMDMHHALTRKGVERLTEVAQAAGATLLVCGGWDWERRCASGMRDWPVQQAVLLNPSTSASAPERIRTGKFQLAVLDAGCVPSWERGEITFEL